jgi:Flp pilus assembly protein TadG
MNRTQQGAQAIEFALVLPFLMLIIFAVLDFGILVYDKSILTNATREAARKAITLSGATWDPAAIRQVACNYARSSLITVSSQPRNATCTGAADPVITVTLPAGVTTPVFNTPVTVSMTYSVSGFSMGTWWSLGTNTGTLRTVGSGISLTSSTVMNHE